MFFDIGLGEVLGLAVLAMFLVGPERLPKVKENLGPGFEDLQPKDLNPKTFVKKQISELLDEENPKAKSNISKAMIDPDLL